jgi:glycine/D-amino acid oxidase-like deaminating enzyme
MATPLESIIVVGAGIFGVTGAIELQRRGYAVALFDPGPLPHLKAASTDISKMIRMDYGADEFYLALMEIAFEGWDAWNQKWPEPLYHQTGFVIMAGREMHAGSFEYDSFVRLQKRGHPVERLDSVSLKTRFPAWVAEKYPDGYYNPRAGWAASGKVVAQLLREAQTLGVQVCAGMTMAELWAEGSKVAGIVTTDGTKHRADKVLVAAGAWTPTLLPWLSDVMWATGQPVLHFRAANPADYQPPRFVPWAADVAHTGWYGFSAQADGTLKVTNHGPGEPIHPDASRTTAHDNEARFRDFLRGTFPGLAIAPLINSRLCLYCDTWDGNLWIDHDPERPGLVVAAGDSGHGFKFAPVLGSIIADVIERRANPYAARFAWRPRGRLSSEAARHSKATSGG